MILKDATRLWEELRHRDPDEKVEWVRQLAQNPTPESIEILLDVLKQESWFLRDQASRALAGLGEGVVDPLIELLGSGLWYTLTAAAAALGSMGLPIAAAPLTELLRDVNRTVRDAVRDALVALCRNEMGRHAVALAFRDLPERAQQFALEGISARDAEVAERVASLVRDPSLRDGSPLPRARAVNEDGFLWDDVVGEGGGPSTA